MDNLNDKQDDKTNPVIPAITEIIEPGSYHLEMSLDNISLFSEFIMSYKATRTDQDADSATKIANLANALQRHLKHKADAGEITSTRIVGNN